ncbi:GNAT domain-containing protein [Desulfonema limicola]|uniref:GNAT domain-containing protein n=1 Tax=Desulfonema limicola TaxID=45656 RepID=A0A975BCR4_9BACT|nr:N-acetyltransferase [Desulfonema limicola]QTA82795.1 GNAT domain-containing protein [Desulfonema limicola]
MIRKANIKDIKKIHSLLWDYGKKGDLLSRSLSQLYDHLRDFWIYEENQELTGCCALQFCWEDLAEIRSLAVHPGHTGKRIGAKLLETAVSEAKEFKIKRLFTLTYRPEFFKKMGFSPIDKSELPLKIWSDCILCVKFPNCDENAMIRYI